MQRREPRAVLAYAPGGDERIALVEQNVPGLGDAAPMSLQLRLKWSTPPTGPSGVRRHFAVLDASTPTPPGASEGEAQILAAIGGMYEQIEGYAAVPGPGRLEVVQTKGLPSAPSVPWMLHSLAVPLPGEALGVGARWTVHGTSMRRELRCTGSREYRLVASTPTGATIELKAEETCASPTQNPGASLLAQDCAFAGRVELDFADILPPTAEIDGTLTMRMRMGATGESGEPRDHTQTTDLHLRVRPEP
jgi:hypothetical protein